MQFRLRPSSKKSNNDLSHVEFPPARSLIADSPLPRTLPARIDQVEAALASLQQSYKRDRQISNAGYIQTQRRLEKVQYKMFGAEQDIRQLNQIRQLRQPREVVAPSTNQPSKNEIMLLKQVLLQDKEAQRDLIKHQNSQIQQLSLKLLRQEQEVRELITEQRMQWESRMSGQQEELRQVEGLKSRKMQQQYQMMKGVIANAERKIYQELERKIRNQAVIKDFVQERVHQAKEELANEHRQTLISEAKFIKETKNSLETLFSLTKTTRKELSQELSETQKLATGSIKRVSMALDIHREKSTDQLREALELHRQVASQLVELRGFMTSKLEENRQIMSEFEELTLERVERGGTPGSRAGEGSMGEERVSLLQKEMAQWKSITEQKNLNVFKEISNTLKAMKIEWRKENDQLVSQVAALNDSLKTVKKSGPNELKKSVQALVSIFNNEFDVLAEELETLTDMIAIAKKENQKQFKQDLGKLRTELQEEMTTAFAQKGKQSALFTEKALGKSEENMKHFIGKEIKFASDSLSQKVEKNEASMLQLDTSIKKMNNLTNSQLEDYSHKLKGFNDSYKDYLEEQRKEDMKKRIQLEDTMRKNSSNLMDICYKKCEFLVDGLKSSLQVAQMKEKVQAAQALEGARDELKKQVQGARIEWQKELSQGLEKTTKERETSQEMLQDNIEQSINNAKRNLTNEIGNNKLQVEEKINELKAQQEERKTEQEQTQIDLKNTVLKMIRDQKKLTEQNIQKHRDQVNTKTQNIQKKLSDQEQEEKNREEANRKSMETYVSAQISKVDSFHKDQLHKVKTQLESSLSQQKQDVETRLASVQKETKQDSLSKEAEIQKKIQQNQQANQKNIAQIRTQIQELNQKMGDSQEKAEKEKVASTQELTNRQTQLDKKIDVLSVQISDLDNKIEKKQMKADQQKDASTEELASRQGQLDKKIIALNQSVELRQKETNVKFEEFDKKISEFQASAQKKQGEGKKVDEDSLKTMKKDLEKSISSLEERVDQLQARDKGEDNEEAIAAVRKSVNKLEAMVFSEQAKNKSIFDRLTQDVNKVGQNLTLITNEIRQ